MKSKFCVAAACALAVLTFAESASAAVIEEVISFTATNFTPIGTSFGPAPVDPVQGSFTITIDPTQDYFNDSADIKLNSINIDLDAPVGFTKDPFGGIQIYGQNAIPNFVSANDFSLDFNTKVDLGVIFTYEQGGAEDSFQTTSVDLTITQVSPAPEPSTWMMLFAGLAMAGVALRVRRRAEPSLI